MFLYGWKEIANFIGCHIRTLRRWHYERLKLPVIKTYPSRRSGAIIVEVETLKVWLTQIGRR